MKRALKILLTAALLIITIKGVFGSTITIHASTFETAPTKDVKKLPSSWKGTWYGYNKELSKRTEKVNFEKKYSGAAVAAPAMFAKFTKISNAYEFGIGGGEQIFRKTTVRFHGHTYHVIAVADLDDTGASVTYFTRHKEPKLPVHNINYYSSTGDTSKLLTHYVDYYVLQMGNKHHKA
ncbi:hypothetical protein EQG49_00535 [Periweissella cryptocerci]|uniref:Uncharacterized protein n=1 Tax=Periweissella cryptocerci TaxID=2506420 RepID=A0A4P6YR09_9LACO|nr:hypothetical protein [Periweissella cryptocerci]QBO35041.1 hypothetical protein EQG49_00535 [Periweissella cryptocerci]